MLKIPRAELISPQGLRIDGRRPLEIRSINYQLGVVPNSDGSAYFEQGNTKVIAYVSGPREVQTGRLGGAVTCKAGISAFSGGEHRKKTRMDRRIVEIVSIVEQSFNEAIMFQLFPRSSVTICIDVLQADGGVLCAVVNAATLALVDAGVPMKDMVCACGVGNIENVLVVDLNQIEESQCKLRMPVVVFPQDKTIVTLEADAKISIDQLEGLLDAGMLACSRLHSVMKEVFKSKQ